MDQFAVDQLVRDRISELHREADRQRVLASARRARRIRRAGRIRATSAHAPRVAA